MEIYTQLNAEFQRIARRGKTLKWTMQRNRENNRMWKTRNFIKKVRDMKATFHAKMGTIKDRTSKHLTEAEEIKKRCQEYREGL